MFTFPSALIELSLITHCSDLVRFSIPVFVSVCLLLMGFCFMNTLATIVTLAIPV